MTKGLPASGKSTWAKDKVEKSGGKIKRVNKDDIRAMVDAGKWSKEREKEVLSVRDTLIERWLMNGYDVIVDDTNLSPKHENRLRYIAEHHEANFIIEDSFLHVPLRTCIERDLSRGSDSVGKDVITHMYYQYIFNPGYMADSYHIPTMLSDTPFLPCIICDIDGTIAFKGNRNPYDLSKVKEDKFNYALWEVIKHFPYPIVFLSGREGTRQCFQDTKDWLKMYTGQQEPILFMRKEGDGREDSVVKQELLREVINERQLNPIMVFDDRDHVVDMWRSHGILTAQMNYGGF